MKLRTKFALVLVVLTLVLGSATYGGLELYKQQALSQSQSSVDESATIAAVQIQSALDERADYVGYVASQPETADFSNANGVIRGVVSNSRFFAAQVVAANGTVVAFDGQIDESVRRDAIGTDVSEESYFRSARYHSASVSDPEYVESRDQYLVVVSAPIIRNGSVRGVLAASIYVSSDTFLEPVEPLSRENQRVTVHADDATLYESRTEFEQSITGRATVDSYGWTVTVQRDRGPLNTRLQQLAFAQGGGLFLILLLIVALWVLEYVYNSRQTRLLLDGFDALRRGDHGHSLQFDSAEEWERISEGFNALATGLDEREKAVREREQRLDVLNRVLRHNVRNEMNVVLGYAELVADRSDDEQTANAAETILDRGERLVSVSEKARWLDGEFDTGDGRTVDAADAVKEVVSDARKAYPDVDVSLSVDGDAHEPTAPSITPAVRNVVENACLHNDNGAPTVDVRVTPDGDDVVVSVADDGPGIPEHERAVLEEGEETALQHGSGIGLWITKWLADRDGGSVSFGENDPRGCVVTLRIPRREGGDEEPARESN
ncbi:cache domain-containing sensor histidine kinase [Halogeometricum limi]|uniref:histidine kinase n=1 Tax=Halogeometricum limi TaxID=555875 RepID=A0A1I6GMB6_9EURY|nr:sensor histidine kinase [Halogeometricum limi]SFR43291.1 Signal transduction histidine kinase [Halogeometricum limi]